MIRPPVDPGPAAWNRLLPDPRPPQPLDGAQTADWLVIGAGFAGLAAARRLAELHPGDRITLLDATRIGDGPAGRNSGFMIDLPHDLSSSDYAGQIARDRATTADNRRAIAFASRMAEEFDLPREAFDPCGKINGAATEAGARHNADYARHLATMQEDHRRLDAQDMREVTGTTFYRDGLFTPGTVMLQPAMFVRGIASGLVSNRVTIHEASPVTGLHRDGDWVATTERGRVTAPRVILAVNGHLERFGHATRRLVHVHTYASITRPLTAAEVATLGGAARWGITPADPLGTTVRRVSGTGGDRIVIRNHVTYDPGCEAGPGWQAAITRRHDASFAARFPMLGSVSIEYRWGGRLCLARNGAQVIGEIDEGLYAACCQNGLGTVRGTLAGLLAAEDASGIASDALTRARAQDLPDRLPPAWLSTPAARARIWWGQRRAGREL
ncbi:NAD(P)/FAD-dependent oxidoreductase [Pseudaestuariivita atlantica]|uniref:Oxidoreductase n=1 Tax=Pseudaestuariivita atlantica TaxID=1317121 RepID=A0A0L1JNA7_9RHOB|nr:FAD-binding oxidoreductase [Pseudaestuariivita atlantica]KNG93245.1 oxidoreductase [Pseudaestuariivita atlantica]